MTADLSSDAGDLPDEFFTELKAVCAELCCDPADMLAVMMGESGVRPEVQHRQSKASGLILFTPRTLEGLGWTAGPDRYAELSAVEQLRFVRQYFAPYARHGLGSSGRLYQATFLPATLAHGSAPQTVVCAEDGPFADVYAANPGLDVDCDGAIRVADLTARMDRERKGRRWEALVARLAGTG